MDLVHHPIEARKREETIPAEMLPAKRIGEMGWNEGRQLEGLL